MVVVAEHRTIAIAYGVDPTTTHWLAETLFHLAIGNPILGITARKRGYQHDHPYIVAKDRGWLKAVLRQKAAVELALQEKITFARLARKITFLECLEAGEYFYEIDQTSEVFYLATRRTGARIRKLWKAYPDISGIPF